MDDNATKRRRRPAMQFPVQPEDEQANTPGEQPARRRRPDGQPLAEGRHMPPSRVAIHRRTEKKKRRKKGGLTFDAWRVVCYIGNCILLVFAALWMLLCVLWKKLHALAGRLIDRIRDRNTTGTLSRRQNALATGAALCVVLMIIGGGKLWDWMSLSRHTNTMNEELASLYEQGVALAYSQKVTPAPLANDGVYVYAAPTASPIPTQTSAAQEETPLPTATPQPEFHVIGTQIKQDFTQLFQINSDLVGWLNIEGVIDLPVVYYNNVYYETHDFYGREDKAGTLFLDKRHRLQADTQNLLIHGHNMKDGTMFGRLLQYEKGIAFLRQHGIVHFNTLYDEETYAIFAVMVVSLDQKSSQFFDYFTHPTFITEADFDAYVMDVRRRSLYSVPIDVNAGDSLITLSTCLNDDRLVILARSLREGETEESMQGLIEQATKQE